MTDEPKIESNEPIKIESEDVFAHDLAADRSQDHDPAWLPGINDPLTDYFSKLGSEMKKLFQMSSPNTFDRPNFEHKVRIFAFNDRMNRSEVCAEIEALLNDGYHFHFPVVCNDYVMLDFSRRKEDITNGQPTGSMEQPLP